MINSTITIVHNGKVTKQRVTDKQLNTYETIENCCGHEIPQGGIHLPSNMRFEPLADTPADEALQTRITAGTTLAQELQDIIADAHQAGSELPGAQTVLDEWETAFKRYNQLQPQ